MSPPQKKLLDQLRHQVNLKDYSLRTAVAYVYWTRQFILQKSSIYNPQSKI
jgi:hypothetical protein